MNEFAECTRAVAEQPGVLPEDFHMQASSLESIFLVRANATFIDPWHREFQAAPAPLVQRQVIEQDLDE